MQATPDPACRVKNVAVSGDEPPVIGSPNQLGTCHGASNAGHRTSVAISQAESSRPSLDVTA